MTAAIPDDESAHGVPFGGPSSLQTAWRMMAGGAPEIVGILTDIARNSPQDSTRVQAGLGLLKMAGFGQNGHRRCADCSATVQPGGRYRVTARSPLPSGSGGALGEAPGSGTPPPRPRTTMWWTPRSWRIRHSRGIPASPSSRAPATGMDAGRAVRPASEQGTSMGHTPASWLVTIPPLSTTAARASRVGPIPRAVGPQPAGPGSVPAAGPRRGPR